MARTVRPGAYYQDGYLFKLTRLSAFQSLLAGYENVTVQCQNCGNFSGKVTKRWYVLYIRLQSPRPLRREADKCSSQAVVHRLLRTPNPLLPQTRPRRLLPHLQLQPGHPIPTRRAAADERRRSANTDAEPGSSAWAE